jgi:electron transport complex protein RnfB
VNFTAQPSAARSPTLADPATLVDRIDAALPQTQCTRCGYPDCRAYAEAVASGAAEINRCPPGGAEGIARLAELTHRPVLPLDSSRGLEGPRLLAVIDEAWCIGCTLCIKACPVDCIIGAPKRMHTVIDALCTGCELCLPVCPVDCIALVPVTGERSGWQAWSTPQADQARQRYGAHQQRAARLQREQDDRPAHSRHTDPAILSAKRAVIDAALARARARQAERDKP